MILVLTQARNGARPAASLFYCDADRLPKANRNGHLIIENEIGRLILHRKSAVPIPRANVMSAATAVLLTKLRSHPRYIYEETA